MQWIVCFGRLIKDQEWTTIDREEPKVKHAEARDGMTGCVKVYHDPCQNFFALKVWKPIQAP